MSTQRGKRRLGQARHPFGTGWGGKRRGAGRKGAGTGGRRNGVAHVARPVHKARFPVHVTVRLRGGLPSMRSQSLCDGAVAQIKTARERFFRILHFSVQANHIHLLVEAGDERLLGRGMKGLGVRLARRVNSLLSAKGQVIGERYHARALATPREVRNALVYVLSNRKKHGGSATSMLDRCASGQYFDGWRDNSGVPVARASPDEWPVAAGKTWLVTRGWKRLGLLHLDERPRQA